MDHKNDGFRDGTWQHARWGGGGAIYTLWDETLKVYAQNCLVPVRGLTEVRMPIGMKLEIVSWAFLTCGGWRSSRFEFYCGTVLGRSKTRMK